MGGFATGADQSGYLNLARLLGTGRVSTAMRSIPELRQDQVPLFTYVPLGFNPNPDHLTLNPVYPPGLPMLIMAVAQVAGWNAAPGLVMAVHALVGLCLTYALGRTVGLQAGWAWLGALLLAACPLYVFSSLQTMSDLPAMVWVAAAILCAWKSRQKTWLALAAGVALSVGVLVRPTNLLAILPVAIALGYSWRRWVALIVGGLPGAVFQGAFNLAAYGHLVASGYGGLDALFSYSNVPVNLVHYAVWLPVLLTPAGLLSFALPLLRRHRPLPFAWLATWALVFPVFYLFYTATHDGWGALRFLLPVFPALMVAGLLVGRELCARIKIAPRSWWLAPTAIAVLVNGAFWSHELHVFTIGRSERAYPQMAVWLTDHLPPNAVITTMQPSGAVFYYTFFPIVRWDTITPADFQRIAAGCAAAGRPLFAVLHQDEINDAQWAAFSKHLRGRWTQIGVVRYLSIWRYDSSAAAP
jgi:hypothetical protein